MALAVVGLKPSITAAAMEADGVEFDAADRLVKADLQFFVRCPIVVPIAGLGVVIAQREFAGRGLAFNRGDLAIQHMAEGGQCHARGRDAGVTARKRVGLDHTLQQW